MLTAMPPADSPKIVTLLGIAAEGRDVPLHPLQAGDQVQEAVVAGSLVRRFRAQLRMREEAERPHAVVDADEHDTLAREVLAVVDRAGGGAEGEAAAVDPDEHRNAVARRPGRRPDVEVEAVLAHVPLAVPLVGIRPELLGRPHALPPGGGLRRAPAEVARGRRGEGDAAVDGEVLLRDALHAGRIRS